MPSRSIRAPQRRTPLARCTSRKNKMAWRRTGALTAYSVTRLMAGRSANGRASASRSSQRGALVALFVPAGPRSHLITRAADRSGSVAALAQRHVLPAVAPGHEPPGACLLVRAQRSPDLALKAAGAVHGGQSACLGSIQSDEPSCINSGHHVGDLVRTLHLRRRGAY
jgi:hypothetical protein